MLDSNEWSTLPVRLRDANAAERVTNGDKEVVWDLLNFLFLQSNPNMKSEGSDSNDVDMIPPKEKRKPFTVTRKPSKEHSFLEHSAVMEELLLRREILGSPKNHSVKPRVPPLGIIKMAEKMEEKTTEMET